MIAGYSGSQGGSVAMKPLSLAAAVLLGFAAACSQTKMLKTWKAPDYQRGSLHKLLVIGVFPTEGVREVVEGQMVEQLKAARVDASASTAFLTQEELDRDAVVKKVGEQAFDGVILARIVDRETFEKYYKVEAPTVDVPAGAPVEWYQAYVETKSQQEAGGYTVASRMDAWVETRVFDARSQKLVWSGVSKTEFDGQDPRQIQAAVGAILNSMHGDGIF